MLKNENNLHQAQHDFHFSVNSAQTFEKERVGDDSECDRVATHNTQNTGFQNIKRQNDCEISLSKNGGFYS